MTAFSRSTEQRIASLLAGGITTSAAISETLQREGHRRCSQSQVKRYLKTLRGPAVARKVAPVAVAAVSKSVVQAKAPDSRLAAEDAAETDVELAKATLRRLLREDLRIAGYLETGASVVDALHSAGHLEAALTLRSPADLAEFVRLLVEDPCSYERGANQSEADFATELSAAGEAEHTRAIELLEGALRIARSAEIPTRYRGHDSKQGTVQ